MSQNRDSRFARPAQDSATASFDGFNPVVPVSDAAAVGAATLSGLPPDWSHLLQTAAQRFDMALLEEGYTGILSAGDIELHVRYATDDMAAWAVVAMPLIRGDEAGLTDNLRYFAVLNHQLMHVTELPLVMGFNPHTASFEALLQVSLDGMDADEFADVLGDFMHQLSMTLQLAA